ncbi:phage holin [Qingrenia yutianensis]|uniref:Phage holin n=1 Tax=Qingrenia yutianensis TaxID=2763676 RepID=A0A926FBI2_9FIRM|nr:phage holin [Qingrenia yutianensis]MBC8596871.1 phage holin [Qingrenia yutianensis]
MINWKVRFKNPVFYVQLGISIMAPIFAYLGITAKDITTWDSFFDIFKQALSNPYILCLIATSIYNAVVDPTTQGIGDSKRAISYNNPVK